MSDLTTKVLIEIRDELKGTNARLDQTNARLDQTNARLDHVSTRLDTHEKVLVRLVDLGERHEQALAKLVGSVDGLTARFDHFLTGAHHEAHQEERRRYADLDARVTQLESERR